MNARDERERLAVLVHEVRSPTAALVAIAAALTEESLDKASRRELLGLAVDACLGIERVVGDAAVSSVRLREVDVAQVVRDAVSASVLTGARTSIDRELGPLVVEADPLRLRQAVDNLVANAVAHSPPDGDVVVSTRIEDGDVLISVADRGPGVPTGERERIFESGVRLDPRRPGSGLGLSIARAIAEAHRGSLTVDSAPEGGAVFTLALPLCRQPAT